MIKKILALSGLSIISTGIFAQDTSVPKFNQDMKISAQIEPGCFLEAENINFGILATPIQDQSATSNMKIHCSKGASLKVEINYLGNNGGESNAILTWSVVSQTNNEQWLKLYINGNEISTESYGDIVCSSDHLGTLGIHSKEVEELLYKTGQSRTYQTDRWGACSGGRVNTSHFSKFNLEMNSGILTGISAGEQINYSILKTNNSVWGLGTEGLTVTGTGSEQIIPMKANIKRAENPTHRMTPDTYQSSLNVILTY